MHSNSTYRGWDDLPMELATEILSYCFSPRSPPAHHAYQQLQSRARTLLGRYDPTDRRRMRELQAVSRSFAFSVRLFLFSHIHLGYLDPMTAFLAQIKEEASGQVPLPIARYVLSLSVADMWVIGEETLVPIWCQVST
jgi:hypothetical protein